jgi:hypothetical protein
MRICVNMLILQGLFKRVSVRSHGPVTMSTAGILAAPVAATITPQPSSHTFLHLKKRVQLTSPAATIEPNALEAQSPDQS